MSVSETIKQARLSLGLTQQQLADVCHTTRRSVYHWENGLRYVPVDKLRVVANTLHLRIDDLVP